MHFFAEDLVVEGLAQAFMLQVVTVTEKEDGKKWEEGGKILDKNLIELEARKSNVGHMITIH